MRLASATFVSRRPDWRIIGHNRSCSALLLSFSDNAIKTLRSVYTVRKRMMRPIRKAFFLGIKMSSGMHRFSVNSP